MDKAAVKNCAAAVRRLLTAAVTQRAEDIGLAPGCEALCQDAARTWFIRLIALRFMEVNGYLPPEARAAGSGREAGGERGRRALLAQCATLAGFLPGLFQDDEGRAALLLPPGLYGAGGAAAELAHGVSDVDFREGVEIVGWLYQHYDAERRETLVNAYRGVVSAEDIPTATQLFTPEWIVRYMVDNTLGRYWLERNPGSPLRASLRYFIADGLEHTRESISPEDIRFFDPCAGTGHILVYAFDVFRRIYAERGYPERDIPRLILANNLFGLDIDDGAARLAAFALAMKARGSDERFFEREDAPWPNVCSFPENVAPPESFDGAGKDLRALLRCFSGAKARGSLMELSEAEAAWDFGRLRAELGALGVGGARALSAVAAAETLARKYHVVVTNPPYLSLNKLDGDLKAFVSECYRGYAGDLFSAFIYRNLAFCAPGGYCAYMTPFVWMFIKTYEKLRAHIINEKTVISLIQMEYSAFAEATVPVCAFVLKNAPPPPGAVGTYIGLAGFRGGMETQRQKALEAIENPGLGYVYRAEQSQFAKLPAMPLAYWVSTRMARAFRRAEPLSRFAAPKQGLATADNGRFLRLWYECDIRNILLECENTRQSLEATQKWYPYNKGGAYRKWYGNNDYVVNWRHNGQDLKAFPGAVLRNRAYYFKPCVTWSKVSSGQIAFRYKPPGHLFDVAGTSVFADEELLLSVCGFCNSVVAREIARALSPTLNYEVGTVASFPFVPPGRAKPRVDRLVARNIAISKADWDSFETSWHFRRHPLLTYGAGSVEEAFGLWRAETEARFAEMKTNEEELNRVFIGLYGLSGELSPEVSERDVTVRRADLARDMRSFVSYAVGVMLGRYSLGKDGLAHAGGPFAPHAGQAFAPQMGNVLPLAAEGLFRDEAASRFAAFLAAAFGEARLGENLNFVANALYPAGTDGPIEKIRRYFQSGFYKDHVKVYRKRPVYWQFDTGERGGFKALAYMHRFDGRTLAGLEADYLRLLIKKLEAEGKSRLAGEYAVYGRAAANAARLEAALDPDDGVAANYARFQGVDGVDLLTKI